jgi:dihydroorotate dehydrogenase (NAD+) catalytic subunit
MSAFVDWIEMNDLPSLILSSGKRDVVINPPIMNASGFLGFADEARRHIDLTQLGAFVTNTISLEPRSPARPPRVLEFPGGFLLHSGHPNPGLSRAIARYHQAWAEMPVPVIVNLLAFSPDEASKMVLALEGLENVMAVELLGPAEPIGGADEIISAACSGELPVIVRLPMTSPAEYVEEVQQSGAHAISLGPPRGTVRGPDGRLISGRLYGPTTIALGLETLRRWSSAVQIPILGVYGLKASEEITILIAASAAGVQIGLPLWRQIHGEGALG